MQRFEQHLSITCAIVAAVWVVVTDGTPLALVVAAALVVSAIIERRSLVWALLGSVLILTGHHAAVLAAAALPAAGQRYDLSHQGLAALRRSAAALLSPVLALGAAVGGYRLGRHKEALWWMIAWIPATLVAVLNIAFVAGVSPTATLLIVSTVGILLALDQSPSVMPSTTERGNPAGGQTVVATGRTVVTRGRTVVAAGGGSTDWTDIVRYSDSHSDSDRYFQEAIAVPDDASSIDTFIPESSD